MRASVFVGVSLDGFIARENGDLDFLMTAPEEDNGFDAFLAEVDAVVLGRKTYETVLAYDRWPYGPRPVVVLSRTLSSVRGPPGSACELMNLPAAEVLARLEARGLTHVYVDGGRTVQAFLSAGLIQDLTVTRAPVLIGRGVPLFDAVPRDIHLEHVRTRSFSSGFVQSEYRVVR